MLKRSRRVDYLIMFLKVFFDESFKNKENHHNNYIHLTWLVDFCHFAKCHAIVMSVYLCDFCRKYGTGYLTFVSLFFLRCKLIKMRILAVYFCRKPITFLWAIKKWAERIIMWWNVELTDKRELTFLSHAKKYPTDIRGHEKSMSLFFPRRHLPKN